jgi:hypothetical protein
MADDNSADINLNLNGDAGPLKEQLEQVKGILDDVNEDANTYMQIMSDTEGRHQNILSSWKDILQAIRDSNSALQSLNATEQAQSTAMSNFRQEIQEILQSVKGLGGNINHVMSIFQMSGGRGVSGMGGAGISQNVGAYDTSLASQDFTGVSTNLDTTSIELANSTKASRFTGLRGKRPVIGGKEVDIDNDMYSSGEYADEVRRVREVSSNTPRQVSLKNQLSEYGSLSEGIVPSGKEYRAASYSMDYAMSTLNNTVGNVPVVGRPIMNAIRRSLEIGGVNRKNIRLAEQNNTTSSIDPETGQTTVTRTGDFSEVEKKALGFANKVADIFGNKFVKAFTEYGGYVTMGVQAAEGIASTARQLTGFAQAQGQVFGQTDYNRSISMGLSALTKSDFGLNFDYSYAQVMQNQMMGASLGLKGNQLNDYVNNALNMQVQYGLDAQQAQQILGGGFAAGVNMNANMAGLALVRQAENTGTLSTAAGNQAYMSTMQYLAGRGVSATAATTAGAQNAYFLTGNKALQAAGVTSYEGQTTQIGQVFLAQALGVPLMQSFAEEKKKGWDQATANAEVNQRILAMAGINIDEISPDNDYNALNPYANILQMILQSIGMTNITSPMLAKGWAKTVISSYLANKAGNPYNQQTESKDPTVKAKHVNSLAGTNLNRVEQQIAATKQQHATTLTNNINTLQQQLLQNPAMFGGANSYNFVQAGKTLQAARSDLASGQYQQGINIIVSLENDAKKHLNTVVKHSHNGTVARNHSKG